MAATTAAVVGGVARAASAANSMSSMGGGGGGAPRWQRRQRRQLAEEGRNVAGGMQVAGFNPDQIAAQQGVRGAQGFLDADSAGAMGTARELAQGVTPEAVRAMYNPYEQDVVNSFMADLQNMRGMNDLAANDLAEKSNAFGGDRDAVYRAVSSGELDRNAMGAIANLRHSGYDTAGRMALSNLGLRLGGNAQLQDIIDARRRARYGDLAALNESGYAQQAQLQREYDLPQNRLRFRSEMIGDAVPTGYRGPSGDPVGAGIAGYQDGYNTINNLLAGWGNTRSGVPLPPAGQSARSTGWNMYGDQR